MPSGLYYSTSGALVKAATIRTQLNTGHVRLYQSSFTPTPSSAVADFIAAEADFDGYPAGGVAIATWLNGGFDPGGGASSYAQPNFAFGPPSVPPVTNLIGGCWIEDKDDALYAYFQFPEAVPMEEVGQVLAPLLNLVDGRN